MINIPVKLLKAVSLAMANNDIRYYLNGVCVEMNKDRITLVATDGHRIHAGTFYAPEGTPELRIVIPANVVKLGLSSGSKFEFLPLSVMPYKLGFSDFEPVEGIFPDWRRVLPVIDAPGVLMPMNPDYVAEISRAAKILHGRNAGIAMYSQKDSGSILVKVPGDDDFIGAIMGKDFDSNYHLPKWAKQ